MPEHQLIETGDGSHSLYVPALDEQYHSRHGAVQESRHVFLRMGLDTRTERDLRIFEMGFGTGLNALLTALEARKREMTVRYDSLEKYPLTPETALAMNYPEQTEAEGARLLYEALHRAPWDAWTTVSESFHLRKQALDLHDWKPDGTYHLVYYDAFGPRVQPALWQEAPFRKLYEAMEPGGTLVTYCAKGEVRRTLQSIGFQVERLPGPPGKREMIRACT